MLLLSFISTTPRDGREGLSGSTVLANLAAKDTVIRSHCRDYERIVFVIAAMHIVAGNVSSQSL
jgi:hypothetical protein